MCDVVDFATKFIQGTLKFAEFSFYFIFDWFFNLIEEVYWLSLTGLEIPSDVILLLRFSMMTRSLPQGVVIGPQLFIPCLWQQTFQTIRADWQCLFKLGHFES